MGTFGKSRKIFQIGDVAAEMSPNNRLHRKFLGLLNVSRCYFRSSCTAKFSFLIQQPVKKSCMNTISLQNSNLLPGLECYLNYLKKSNNIHSLIFALRKY